MKLTVKKGQDFRFCNGQSVKSVAKLVENIRKLSPDEFSHHVNVEKNDFHTWIKDCISPEMALAVAGLDDQREFVEKLTGLHWQFDHQKKFNY